MESEISINFSDSRQTSIYIGSNILYRIGEKLESKKVLLISNPTIHELYGNNITCNIFKSEVYDFLIPEGEKYKNLNTVSSVYDFLVEKKFGRDSYILALGGGVIGDIAGFVASTYMRGIPYIQIPTTLLAQVDSSIGGKVAVNHPEAKNLIGAFYQPKYVYSDIKTLETLPQEEFINGMAEVLKYSLIGDSYLFNLLEENNKNSIRDEKTLYELVLRCAHIKADIVEKDEKDKHLRMILNFGHTIGHAIETVSGYTLKHGAAVSVGMVAAIRLSVKKGYLKNQDEVKILDLFKKYDLPLYAKGYSAVDIYYALKYDKKINNDKVLMILLESIGKKIIYEDADEKLLLESISEVCI